MKAHRIAATLAGMSLVLGAAVGCGESTGTLSGPGPSLVGTAPTGTGPTGTSAAGTPATSPSGGSGAAGPTGGGAVTGSATSPGPGGPAPSPGASGAADPHNAADVTFAAQMLVHHRGAVAMAELAPTRASSSRVKDLAARIEAEQTGEIAEMSGWLARWSPGAAAPTGPMSGQAMPTMPMSGQAMSGPAMPTMPMSGPAMPTMPMSAAGSGTAGTMAMGDTQAMPGMMTATQMAALTAARGPEFDRMFLQLMITHHRGALDMARTERADGANPGALALAGSILTGQAAEIATMQSLLAG